MAIGNVDPRSQNALEQLVIATQELAGNLATEGTLAQSLTALQDILLELHSVVHEDGTVELGATTLDALEQVTATILGLPSDYPDVGTHTKLDTLNTALGVLQDTLELLLAEAQDTNTVLFAMHGSNSITDLYSKLEAIRALVAGTLTVSVSSLPLATGAATSAKQDTGNSSLASIDTKLTNPLPVSGTVTANIGTTNGLANDATLTSGSQKTQVTNFPTTQPVSGTVAVSNLPATQPVSGAVTVSNFPTDYPSTGANTKLDTLHTDLGHITDATQQTKITDGTTVANVVSGDTGQNSLVASPAHKSVPVSLTNTATGWIDVSNFKSAAVVFSTAGGTTKFQVSPKNDGTMVIDQVAWAATGTQAVPSLNMTTSVVYVIPIFCKYLQITSTSTIVGVLDLSANHAQIMEAAVTPVNGGFAVTQGTAGSAPWSVGGTSTSTSINAATTATTGSTVSLGLAMSNQTMVVTVGGTGSFSALTVIFEGSLDGTTWFTLATMSAAGGGAVFSVNQPCSQIRARTTVATVASLVPTITAKMAGAL